MIVVQSGIDIDASVDEVWNVLTDFRHWKVWNPVFIAGGGEARVGEHVELFAEQKNGRKRDFHCQVIEVVPAEKWSWVYDVVGKFFLHGEHQFCVKGQADHTRFTQMESFEGIFSKLLVDENHVRSIFDRMNHALKDYVESLAA
ncbi:MAG: SRPBCC domain-containing protein [Anaerolineaceae bacterium]|nr:SRPBCC domain-containing protein [Anaerolineaceae bacterium]